MKYRIVGDIHGQLDVLEQALDNDAYQTIFVGDFLDSWTRSAEDQITCLKLVLSEIEDGGARAVWGNHEWSYLDPLQRCSGWNAATQGYFFHIAKQVLEKFEPFIYLEDQVLITHAGLTKQLWLEHGLTMDNFQDKLREWSKNFRSPYFQVGRRRGGVFPCGGPLWCDYSEFQHIEGLRQVFGHSRGKEFRVNGNATCIDVLENSAPKFLDLEF